ncbi:MAG: AMP-binding protein, partial [Pseudomonadota bacterium]
MHASPPPYLAAILENLESRSNEDAYVFLADGERVGESATYSQMRRRVFNFARLLRRSFPPGSRVVLALPPGVAFAVAFIGGLLSGCILVPVKPPGMRASRWRESLDNCLRDCAPAAIVTTPTYLDEIAASLTADPTWRDIQWIAYQHDDSEASPLAEFPGEGEIAFIQYTSGSTSAPKGVRVSFRNLMANAIIMRDALGQSAETVFVSWLPLYHDMGLIGGVLQSAFLGSKYVFFAPANFLQKPERWLRAISAYRATITASPNFGFQHCVDRIDVERLGPLDLSSLSGGACNGAEPVSAATIERFVEKFARFGVGDDFIRPVYGMAEATLMVSAAPRTEPVQLRAHVSETAVRSSPVVSCGFVRGDQEAIIVDPDAGARRPDRS